MTRPWVNNEDGPDCYCGDPTVVKTTEAGSAVLLCLFHNNEAGAIFRLPTDRPDNFATLSLDELIDRSQP